MALISTCSLERLIQNVLPNLLLFSLQLQCVEGNILVASGENKMEVPFLKPDEQGELVVPFIAPATPGHYERYVTCTCVVTIRVTRYFQF